MSKEQEMYAPCRCDCGNLFDLHEGWESLKTPNKVICYDCYDKEAEAQQQEDEIQETKDEIEAAHMEIESLQDDISTEKEKIKRLTEKLKSLGVEYP